MLKIQAFLSMKAQDTVLATAAKCIKIEEAYL